MKPLTIGRILEDFKDVLTQGEMEDLRGFQRRRAPLADLTKQLHIILFSEEYDVMDDSSTDLAERNRGINPMRSEYIERVALKRAAFKVTPLRKDGRSTDMSSHYLCEEIIRHTKNYKEYLDIKSARGKQIVFVEMDRVLLDFDSAVGKISEEEKKKFDGKPENVPGIFSSMAPREGAIDGYKWLSKYFDTYVVSTVPMDHPEAWADKVKRVKKHLPNLSEKRLILVHDKRLLRGDYLIEHVLNNSYRGFHGKTVVFGPEEDEFEDWKTVISYMKYLT